MKILAFTDTHENTRVFPRLRSIIAKEGVSLAICTGDVSVFGRKLDVVLEQINALGVPVIFIHGNHEDEEEVASSIGKYKNIHWIHGKFFSHSGLQFFGWGGGGFHDREQDLEELEEELADRFTEKTIVLTHAPPARTALDQPMPDWHVGSESMRDLVRRRRPLLLLCGHIHECFHVHDSLSGTLLINPGPDGEIIEVDDD